MVVLVAGALSQVAEQVVLVFELGSVKRKDRDEVVVALLGLREEKEVMFEIRKSEMVKARLVASSVWNCVERAKCWCLRG